jgi:2-amino-4-ketopentanoate thiolase alpha subunit
MAELVPAGTWVELHRVVLAPGERAPQVPDDTQRVPLELRVKGRLLAAAAIGDEAEIETPSGRRVTGRLESVAPAHTHTFGPPEPALLDVGAELRTLLRPSEEEP